MGKATKGNFYTNGRGGDTYGPRFRASPQAVLRRLGLTASIAIALAGCAEPGEIKRQQAQRAFDDAYDRCISRVTGYFSSASIEVMRECDRQARAAKGEA